MNRFAKGLAATSLGLLAGVGAAAQPAVQYPPAWPRPGATLLIENDRGAAYDVTYLKDRPSPVHQHQYPFVGLDLETSAIKVTELSGTAHVFPVVRGNMWFLAKGTPHQEMSITAPARHAVVIDIKDKSVAELANPTRFPTNAYALYQKKVVDNDRVTIWDCAWAPGVEGIASFNSRDIFLLFAEGGELAVTGESGPPLQKRFRPGAAIFLRAGQVRAFSAIRGTVHVMLVELK